MSAENCTTAPQSGALTLRTRKLRLGELEQLAQGHTAARAEALELCLFLPPALGLGVTSGWLSPTWSSWSCASHWLFPIAVVKNPPNNLWIIAAVLAPIAVVTIIIIIITAVLCRKNKNDFKPDTMINLPQRAKVRTGMERPGGLPGALPAFLPGFKTSTFRIMVESSF